MALASFKIGKRKRPREEIGDPSCGQPKSDDKAQVYDQDRKCKTSIGGPLQGVIACLSGLAQDEKGDLHRLILALGGRYTRELNLDKNTHLITETAKGAKFELAASSNPPVIHIVTPSWVISASESGQRAQEKDHRLQSTIYKSEENRTDTTTDFSNRPVGSLANDGLCKTMDSDYGSDVNLSSSFLFEKLQFYLIGFEDNPELKQKISKLIRRGNGTIHWDMNDDISILLLCDTCDDALRKAATIITTHHSNFPPIVSPLWVIESYKHSTLKSVSAYPTTGEEPLKSNHSNDRTKSKTIGAKMISKTSPLSSTTSNVSIFRGCLFSLVHSTTLIEHKQSKCDTTANIEFDPKDLEALITAHGGQTLSVKLVTALRTDEKITHGLSKRKCLVVCWGETPPRLETNPLVSQLERHNLCEIILVTPIWLQTCVSVRKRIRPERMPLVLVPQPWPMKSALNAPHQPQQSGENQEGISEKSDHYHRGLEIALTGFQGTEKVVIVHLINAIGGVYHDNMSNANTHLIFKKSPTGLKLEKAIEWGLHAVSVQWLYHILKHGYGGVHKDKLGCEKRFSFGVES